LKKVLFIAYHHPNNKSNQSTAIVRRIGQYHEFFESINWEIDYIVTRNSDRPDVGFGNARVLQVEHQEYIPNRILNKIFMFFVILVFGDIVGYSFYLKRNEISSFLRTDYDLVISFFTPRGTIWLGNKIKSKLKKPWWIDVQDSLDEGLAKHNFIFGINWLRNKLKPADHIIHVSPEWKTLDEKRVQKNILVQRHCVPDPVERIKLLDDFFLNAAKSKIKLFYGGNIHFQAMSPELLKPAMENANNVFYFAGSDIVFNGLVNLGLNFKKLGLLDQENLISAYQNSDIIIIFAWNNQGRQVIPSKFYEACAFNKPILIVGKDSGSFNTLFKEWGHPNVVLETKEEVVMALKNFESGDLSNLFLASNCTNGLSDKKQFTGFLNSLLYKSI